MLLTPGISQIYYGDETARPLEIEGADGDANLRSNMNWEDIKPNSETESLLNHYQRLGQFRRNHPSVGAGKQTDLQNDPYVFFRKHENDEVIISVGYFREQKLINVASLWKDGTKVRDFYTGTIGVVRNGTIVMNTNSDTVLLERID